MYKLNIHKISNFSGVDGRMERIDRGQGYRVVVDYAHTPDALHHVLETINKIRTGNEILITVFGCDKFYFDLYEFIF